MFEWDLNGDGEFELQAEFRAAEYDWEPQFTELSMREMCRRLGYRSQCLRSGAERETDVCLVEVRDWILELHLDETLSRMIGLGQATVQCD